MLKVDPIIVNAALAIAIKVDGHFQKAGFTTDGIIECHGSIRYLQCVINCKWLTWPAEDLMVDVDSDYFLAVGDLPRCPDCGGLARPNILMFGDRDWISARFDMQRYTFHLWREQAVKSELGLDHRLAE